MAYSLRRLVAHAHEVLLDGVVIGRLELVKRTSERMGHWRVTLDPGVHPTNRPAPFTGEAHTFRTFAAAAAWLRAEW